MLKKSIAALAAIFSMAYASDNLEDWAFTGEYNICDKQDQVIVGKAKYPDGMREGPISCNIHTTQLRCYNGSELNANTPKLTNLKQLRLYDWMGTSFLPELGQLTTLRELVLDGCRSPMPEYLEGSTYLQNLECLSLAFCRFEPGDFYLQFTSLKTLNLFSCKIGSLPESIGTLTNLTSLFIGNNQLKELPSSFSNLTNLTNINLSGWQGDTIPEQLFKLKNLYELMLDYDHNRHITFNEDISKLVNLEKLILSQKCTTLLPRGVLKLTKLRSFAAFGAWNILLRSPWELFFLPQIEYINCQLTSGYQMKVNKPQYPRFQWREDNTIQSHLPLAQVMVIQEKIPFIIFSLLQDNCQDQQVDYYSNTLTNLPLELRQTILTFLFNNIFPSYGDNFEIVQKSQKLFPLYEELVKVKKGEIRASS